MVKGAWQQEWPRHLSTHTHTHWTLPTTMSVLETPFDIHVSSVYQTHTCMQAPVSTLCISAKKTQNKGSRTRPIMSTLMPRSGIPVICSRATLSCDSSYYNCQNDNFQMNNGDIFYSFAQIIIVGTYENCHSAISTPPPQRSCLVVHPHFPATLSSQSTNRSRSMVRPVL